MANEKQKAREEYKERMKRKNRKAVWIMATIILLIILAKPILTFVWGPIGVNIDYSRGERTAMVIKISEKGLVWKTWEAEAVLSQKGFAVTYIWAFSIDNENPNKELLLQKLDGAFESGEVVKIDYVEKAGYVPWRSKTNYLIENIRFSE